MRRVSPRRIGAKAEGHSSEPAIFRAVDLGRTADARAQVLGYGRLMDALGRRPLLLDGLLAGVFIALAELEAVLGLATREVWLHGVLAPVFLAPLALRRRFPLVSLTGAVTGLIVLDPQTLLSFFGAVILASYTAGTVLEAPRTYAAPVAGLAPFAVILVQGTMVPSDLVAFAVFFVGPWGVGRLVRERVAHAHELVRLSARDRERETASAVEDERARMARELHDIVSQSISVISVQTQAVRRRLGPGNEREIDDLRSVETAAREAMAEMRRLFGVLRADGGPAALAPQPGLDQLDGLVEHMRGSGLPLEVAVEGERVPLPPGVDLAAYRIVQEALTNALRHAGSAPTRVLVRFGDSDLEVTIEDDGPGVRNGDAGGHGLLGMRERVALYGGVLETGSSSGGGFRVHARLPFRESAT